MALVLHSGQTIFVHKSHIVSSYVNVIRSGYSGRVYFGQPLEDRETSERARRAVEEDSDNKVLYRIRVKFEYKFPIIGKKRGPSA